MGYESRHPRPAKAPALRPADPPIPHPSWRKALLDAGACEPAPEEKIADADDFWKRLGI